MQNCSKTPVFSIITPSWNQGRFIEETIRSVLNQEGEFSVDYIIIDGGSTDNSVEIIKKYETLLIRGEWPIRCRGIQYRWISEKDNGQTDAINKGIRMSTGEIIAWLNSDDTYSPGALQKVCDAFTNNPACDIVYGKTFYIGEDGKAIGQYPTEPFSRERLAVSNFICQPSAFFRRTVLDRVGYPDVNLRYAMDYDLWIRMAERHQFLYLREFLAHYRLHSESKTVSSRHALENSRECLQVVKKHYHWAPANRVYGYYYQWYHAHVPFSFLKIKPIMILAVLVIAGVNYCALNRGIKRDDIKYLSFRNLKKVFSNQHLHQQ
jgi:glycosyltransferase involved in cell wall biosynthesis